MADSHTQRFRLISTISLLSSVGALGCGSDEGIPPFDENRYRPSGAIVVDSGANAPSSQGGGPTIVSTGGASGVGSQAPPVTNVQIGRQCLSSADCGDGLDCLTSESTDFLGGGPANGYCTKACTGPQDTSCTAFDPTAQCVQTADDAAFCMQGCERGAPLLTKCHDRVDVACDDLGQTGAQAICRPACDTDDSCGDGFCHFGFGICLGDAPEGDPIGSQCDPDLDESTCASGLCLTFGEDHSVCSGVCAVTATDAACGSNSLLSPESPGEPLCSGVFQGTGAGDVGRCNQRCDCDDDCLHPNAACWTGPFGGGMFEDGAEIFGSKGLCVGRDEMLPEDANVGVECVGRDAGTDGGADGGADASSASDPDASSMMSPDASTDSSSSGDSGADLMSMPDSASNAQASPDAASPDAASSSAPDSGSN